MIFQDPYASLNPRWTVSSHHQRTAAGPQAGRQRKPSATERVQELLQLVGLSAAPRQPLPARVLRRAAPAHRHRPRPGLRPAFIVCDEPISALDVSIQAQVVNLLEDLQDQFGLTYLFIAHDLSMVRHICDRVAVMYLGVIVEAGRPRRAVREPAAPLHPGAALRRADPRPEEGPHPPAHHPDRRRAQPDQPAHRLPLPPALPDCQEPLLRGGTANGARSPRPLGRLPRSGRARLTTA